MQTTAPSPAQPHENWLQRYYFLRAGVSILWIALAVTVGKHMPVIGAALMVLYPAWDALANYLDARRSGGLGRNPTQALNLAVSIITAVAIGWALTLGMPATIKVFGAWAIFSGLLQLGTAVRRWKRAAGQWVMILSGAQSAAAGMFFFKQATSGLPLDVTTVAPYAGLGAFYFLVSAIWLTVKMARARSRG
jgi:uncharacterized membrane protein HdeD (DUF308 family)